MGDFLEHLEYLYLDNVRLEEYVGSYLPGSLTQVKRSQRDTPHRDDSVRSAELNSPRADHMRAGNIEILDELTAEVSQRGLVTRLFEVIGDRITKFDEFTDIDVTGLSRRQVVEIGREFSPSPVNTMIESMIEMIEMMRGFGMGELDSPDNQAVVNGMALLFRSGDDDREVHMVHGGNEGSTTVLFGARRRYIRCKPEDFDGLMTVVGRIERVIPSGASVDLFDLFKIIPRSLRRAKGGSRNPKDSIIDMLSKFPDELGGPVDREALTLFGPVLLVSPLCAYN